MDSEEESLTDFSSDEDSLMKSAYQSDQPGPPMRPPPYIPRDNPPSYETSDKGFRTIRCEVCDTEIKILISVDRLTVRCNCCRVETPVGPPPRGQKFVRCPCSCLITCDSDLVWVQCPRPGCREVIDLLQPKKPAKKTPTALPKTNSSYGTILPNDWRKLTDLLDNRHQTQPSSADLSEREAREIINLLQSGKNSAREGEIGQLGTSHCPPQHVATYDDPPPPYDASEQAFRTVRCEVCERDIRIVKNEDKLTVRCNYCEEETPIGVPPRGRIFVRCSCSSLIMCRSDLQRVHCTRSKCREVIELSPPKSPEQATPTASPPPPRTANATSSDRAPNTDQLQRSNTVSSERRPTAARDIASLLQDKNNSGKARKNGQRGAFHVAGYDDLPPSYDASEKAFRTIRCEVCDSDIRIPKNVDDLTVRCNNCEEETPARPPPAGKCFVRCWCSCLLICRSDLARARCTRIGCGEVINLRSPEPPAAPPQTANSTYGTRAPNALNTKQSSNVFPVRRPTANNGNTRLQRDSAKTHDNVNPSRRDVATSTLPQRETTFGHQNAYTFTEEPCKPVAVPYQQVQQGGCTVTTIEVIDFVLFPFF